METNLSSIPTQEVPQLNPVNQKIRPPAWFILLLIIYIPIFFLKSWIFEFIAAVVKSRYINFGLDVPFWLSSLPQIINYSLIISIIGMVISSFYLTPIIRKFLSMFVLVPFVLSVVFVTLFSTTMPEPRDSAAEEARRVKVADEEILLVLESIKDDMPSLLSKISCLGQDESGTPRSCFFLTTFSTNRDTLLSDEEVKTLESSLKSLSPMIQKYKNFRYGNQDYFKQNEGGYFMKVRLISSLPYDKECLNKFYLDYVCDVYSDKVSCTNKTLEVCKR